MDKYWVVEWYVKGLETWEPFHPFTGVKAEDEQGARQYAIDYFKAHDMKFPDNIRIGEVYEDPQGSHE